MNTWEHAMMQGFISQDRYLRMLKCSESGASALQEEAQSCLNFMY
jgi:hypothetical protein